MTPPTPAALEIRADLANRYADVLTPEALDALAALSEIDGARMRIMDARIARRAARARA